MNALGQADPRDSAPTIQCNVRPKRRAKGQTPTSGTSRVKEAAAARHREHTRRITPIKRRGRRSTRAETLRNTGRRGRTPDCDTTDGTVNRDELHKLRITPKMRGTSHHTNRFHLRTHGSSRERGLFETSGRADHKKPFKSTRFRRILAKIQEKIPLSLDKKSPKNPLTTKGRSLRTRNSTAVGDQPYASNVHSIPPGSSHTRHLTAREAPERHRRDTKTTGETAKSGPFCLCTARETLI